MCTGWLKLHETWSCKLIEIFFIPINIIVRLLDPQSGNSQGQETFLAPSADKQIHTYDTECWNYHPLLQSP